ncbi:hypothetical protein I4U23_008456 [Adineta vaga]|nr:hypothetical protein I4U23_008456 [Adineta vaga]
MNFNGKTICSNTSQTSSETEISPFKARLNQRLIYLGQQFSHINITKLRHIQLTSTQTLTYFCWRYCGGWGDRIRGIVSTYILAILMERRFIIDMQYPCNLSHFLVPNLINWTPQYRTDRQNTSLKLDPMHHPYAGQLYKNISTIDMNKLWAKYDQVFLTTNGDYVAAALQNPFFRSIKSQINIHSSHLTQQAIFPFIFELLFKPTSVVIDTIDPLLRKTSQNLNKPILCMHIRLGQNPTIPKDEKLSFRQFLAQDMTEFIDRNLRQSYPSIFITTDSHKIQNDIYQHYNNNLVLSIAGPIIHIDRYDKRRESNRTRYTGFLK